MATGTRPAARALKLYRLNEAQFTKMCAADVFGDRKVELLGGLIFPMVSNPPHCYTVLKGSRSLNGLLPVDAWTVWEEKSIRLDRYWIPSPDLAVARGSLEVFATRLSGAPDLAMVVEVSDTTYPKDRGPKWRKYAAVGIPIYWIANLAKRQIEVYSDPAGRGMAANYRQCHLYGLDAEIPLILDGRELGRIAVKDLLP